LLEERPEIKQWLKDDPKSEDRAELMNLAAEISAAVLKIYDEGPAVVARHHDLSAKSMYLVEKGSTIVDLKLKKAEDREAKSLHYSNQQYEK
jgi:hypothetical protein